MTMDVTNPVIQLCSAGARAEYEGRHSDAAALYQQAWETASNDYEACIAAHYVARFQTLPEETLRWNLEALKHAQADAEAEANSAEPALNSRVAPFLHSLYLNIGQSYERMGQMIEARRYYQLAARLGAPHRMVD